LLVVFHAVAAAVCPLLLHLHHLGQLQFLNQEPVLTLGDLEGYEFALWIIVYRTTYKVLLTIQRHSIILRHSSLGIHGSTINDGTSA
jgi:hypothetical protein